MGEAQNDEVTALLARFPGSLTLSRSMRKTLRPLAIAVGFVALGIVFIRTPETFTGGAGIGRLFGDMLTSLGLADSPAGAVSGLGWVTVAFFGAGSVVLLASWLPGGSGLTLDADGFLVRNLFRRYRYLWRDTASFAVVEVSRQKIVGFNDVATTGGALGTANVALTGRNSAVPNVYALSTEDLARLMSLWRERAIAASAEDAT